jgi:poly(hydroxyalkanoate) depolymerase family esterase
MNSNLNSTMQETMRLMQSGDLRAATLAIQRGLSEQGASAMPGAATHAAADVIDAEFRVLRNGDRDGFATRETPGPSPATPPGFEKVTPVTGDFREHRFAGEHGSIQYKLFLPAGRDTAGLPLIVMLHCCTESPDDFARGTRMNALAQAQGYAVMYPAQSQKQNATKCWNWFRQGDQQRGRGEPALLAALTRHVVAAHGLDAARVYVAGLSAGGAMAAVLGSTYPDVFAAIGVHSGLPFGVAHDVASAFAAMHRTGMNGAAPATPERIAPVPAIVFHGDRDTTVDPCNGAAVIDQFAGTQGASANAPAGTLGTRVVRGATPAGRSYTRTIFTAPDAKVVAEQWLIHGAGHAWSGGDQGGSYTDPSGPDASAQMIRFFADYANTPRE